jgi:hypothetical protein
MATPTNLPASFSSGAVLTAAQQNDLRGAFRVLQVISATYATQTGSSSATYVTTGLTASITPQATTNKILVNVSVPLSTSTTGDTNGVRLVRTIGATTTVLATWTYALYNSAGFSYVQFAAPWVDSPSSTSAITYTLQFARTAGSSTVYSQVGGTPSSIVLQEISA